MLLRWRARRVGRRIAHASGGAEKVATTIQAGAATNPDWSSFQSRTGPHFAGIARRQFNAGWGAGYHAAMWHGQITRKAPKRKQQSRRKGK